MAKQRGIVFLEGTIGGINFYYRKGVPTARMAGGGFNRKAIKTSPSMARIREQNSEFAKCSKVNKEFKNAIRPFLSGYKDGSLHSRLMTLFLRIRDCDVVSERGKREVWQGMTTEQGKRLLKDFVFTPKRSVLLPCHYEFDWNTLQFKVTGFDVSQLRFPDGATFMELGLGVICFDFEQLIYTTEWATPLTIDRDFIGNSFSLGVAAVPVGTGQLLAIVRVAFYQEVNGTPYLLPGDGAYGLEVFVQR